MTLRAQKLLYVVTEDKAFLSHRLPMARAARDAGFDVHVATSVGPAAEAIRAEGFTIHPMPLRRGGLSPLGAISTIQALRKIKRELDPAIVHHVGMQICVLGGISSLGMTTPQINAMTGLGYAFTSTTAQALLLRIVIAVALRFLLNRDHAVFLVQNPDDRTALETIGIDHHRLARIPGSGVDTDKLTPLPEPDGPISVGFAGRLLTSKGIRALVAAHRILRTQGMDIRLLIAGTSDPANPDSVTLEEAQQWNSEPGIKWLGQVGDIASLWRDSHIAALPSHREGLPKSLLEAAACGRPMVATDAPGCREIVIHEETGLLVPIEDPPALAKAIGALAASKELRTRYGAAARQLVVDEMSAQAIGAATVALYEEQLQRIR
ncbi:MAG: glycosyltransferase family 4 protein [Candidatus Afipia apatlaquensis]|uniref:Glycosyltransferase family 4 protein n=1 Tax=Candidatus Afipia apatlaquensis TaxID=2712852 RepID=A0A7C9RCN1_9BRAD|nr:glycosyltransferase family 4 protein [Candidatus Afipia apatlaquensis]